MDTAHWSQETLPGGTALFASPQHPFGTDSFLLAHFARPHRQDMACDLGAGCGIIGALLLEQPFAPRRVDALELQPAAVALMARTVAHNGLGDRLRPVLGDLRRLEGTLPREQYQLVVCNPPYFPRGTGLTAPDPARLAARHEGEESCTLEEVCAAAAWLLQYGGTFCLCHRPQRLVDLLGTLRAQGLEPKRLRTVQQRAGKAPWLILVEAKKGGAPSLQLEAPLIMEEADGALTPEGREIYQKANP